MDAPEVPGGREWRAPRLTGPQVYYLATLGLGLVGIAECVVLLASRASGHVAGATFAGFFGAVFAACALGLILVPARRVERLADGSYRFVSPVKSLRVAKGELLSIRCLVPDPSRLWPMRVTATSGRILLAPRIGDVGALCRELGAQNPAAGITDPDPFSKRFERPLDE